MRTKLGYTEKSDNLQVRIESHKQFSNFSLDEWLDKNLSATEGNIILDLGCGSGNFFPCYSKKLGKSGVIMGIDKNVTLLCKARRHAIDTPFILLEADMNKTLPFIDETFDICVSTFAIYYVDEPRSALSEIKRVIKKEGEALLLGPTDNNARELYDFNEKIFAIPKDDKASKRTKRLQGEFYPAMETIFGNVSCETIPSRLCFPGMAEFIRYYMATLLFEESSAKAGFKPTYKELLGIKVASYDISKEMVVLKAKKYE